MTANASSERVHFSPAIVYCDQPTIMKPELRNALNGIFGDLEWLIPTWCHRITVLLKMDAQGAGESAFASMAQCVTDVPYRKASIVLAPSFLTEPEDAQRRCLLHEIVHIALAPFHDAANEEIMRAYRNDQSSSQAQQTRARMIDAMEMTVCDFTNALLSRS